MRVVARPLWPPVGGVLLNNQYYQFLSLLGSFNPVMFRLEDYVGGYLYPARRFNTLPNGNAPEVEIALVYSNASCPSLWFLTAR